ncbi:DUF6923 family protein [Niabella sp. CJ426]|uniref:DUF6923 family protein n=1 Tax=Niabella sp. CJ426 TaxID=3393740 RepID=UPI003D00E605
MKQRLKKALPKPLFWLTALFLSLNVFAQSPTQVNCSGGYAYIINSTGESNTSDLYAFDVATGSATLIKAGIIPSGGVSRYVNALGYNPIDGYMYGYLMYTGKVFRIGANGAVEEITVADPGSLLPTGISYVAGDVASNGIYYLYDYENMNFISIDLNSATPTAVLEYNVPSGTFSGSGSANNINDFVFSPIDGNIYGVTSGLELFRYNPTTNTLTVLGTVSGTSGTGTYGTAFMDNLGNMFVGNNLTGEIYKIATPNTLAATGGSIAATPYSDAFKGFFPNDGARCARWVAPIAKNDSTAIAPGVTSPVTLDVKVNDVAGTYALNPTSVQLYTVGSVTPDADGSIFITGKGTFTLNPATGVVTFTPVAGFTGEAIIEYTIKDNQGNISNHATIKVTVDATLPVTLGSLEARVVNGQLIVNWSTLSEWSNAYFDIEISKDGGHFVKIGTVNSLAANGNSSSALHYNFKADLAAATGLLGISLFTVVFGCLLFNKRNQWVCSLMIAAGLIFIGLTSCSKQDAAMNDKGQKVFVRLKQVDKDGNYKYVKVVEAIQQ